mmetsp:Transcript_89944/g.251466  ORF Transcript_89944/g.251466 Transcript_89944/m.251466 type:complete len:338 (-) Transcript_89944:67-1080(-)|eukprot:CAMPEP_0176247406 /NCGR_PEP_ID=MMETSP0121_2-20121125/32939_1 /TAXON_ID=160619 /ORGANISM="Kryptoperidinium foliaceum, Strain CCMP 1326" /LENGTH=337 /DNA_ID=CAMNT_0017587061 /DNA_START=43 /DNA_END=1056 /DNA_ORIENTATION=+
MKFTSTTYTLFLASYRLSAAFDGGAGGKNFAAQPPMGSSGGWSQNTNTAARGGAGSRGHGMVQDKYNNKPTEKSQMFQQQHSMVMTEATTNCIHETGMLLKNTEVQHAVAQLSEESLNMDLTGNACVATEAGGHTCTLDFSDDTLLQDVCNAANGTYTEADHTVICTSGLAPMYHDRTGVKQKQQHANTRPEMPEGQQKSAVSIIFNLKALPDCLGHSCTNTDADTSLITTKSSHRLEGALRSRMATPTGLPFTHEQQGRWTCNLDLEGTETHLGSMMHESFLDAKKEEETLSEVEKKEELTEQLNQVKEQQESNSSAFTAAGVALAAANVFLLLVL